MATAATGWACTQDVSIVAETNTTVTVRVICYWQNQGWRYNMNYVSRMCRMCHGPLIENSFSEFYKTRYA